MIASNSARKLSFVISILAKNEPALQPTDPRPTAATRRPQPATTAAANRSVSADPTAAVRPTHVSAAAPEPAAATAAIRLIHPAAATATPTPSATAAATAAPCPATPAAADPTRPADNRPREGAGCSESVNQSTKPIKAQLQNQDRQRRKRKLAPRADPLAFRKCRKVHL